MWRRLDFNSVVWILLGIFSVSYGGYLVWLYKRALLYNFQFTFGLIFCGIAMIFCGFTNGFTDVSPPGRKMKKLGLLAFIPGIPLLLWGIWKSI